MVGTLIPCGGIQPRCLRSVQELETKKKGRAAEGVAFFCAGLRPAGRTVCLLPGPQGEGDILIPTSFQSRFSRASYKREGNLVH